jgi:hypothetical protein
MTLVMITRWLYVVSKGQAALKWAMLTPLRSRRASERTARDSAACKWLGLTPHSQLIMV